MPYLAGQAPEWAAKNHNLGGGKSVDRTNILRFNETAQREIPEISSLAPASYVKWGTTERWENLAFCLG